MVTESDKLPPSLAEQLAGLRYLTDGSSDLLTEKAVIGGIPCMLLACEGMISSAVLSDLVVKPLSELPELHDSGALFHCIHAEKLLTTDRAEVFTYGDVLHRLYSGFAVLLAEGQRSAMAFGVQGFDRRSIGEPSGETNILGAHEGFTEAIRTNLSMLRRRMKTPLLKFELHPVGKLSRTDTALCYLTDRVPPQLVSRIRDAILHTELDTLLTTGYLQPFIEEQPNNLFDSVSLTERPDVLCAKLLEGRIAVFIDGNPFALVVPKLFAESFQSLDDYSYKPWYAAFIRYVKYGAFLLTLLLPALYTAVSVHHPELLNSTLLLLLTKAEADEPLSLPLEAIGVLLMYEIIREASLRLPKVVGGAVSILGGLIIGDAAVASGLISTPMLTVAAIAVTAGFIVPDLAPAVTVLRLLFVAAGGIWGLFGIGLLGMAVLFCLCRTETYGFPVTAPLSPLHVRGLRDVLTRIGFRKMQTGNFTVEEYHEQTG
ncbi:MAG: spore germination protein [Oscillospiraceae bacterium]|nr:spore germination protein [Oscillospiraceae bacterium]